MSFWQKAGNWLVNKAVPWVAENLLGIGDVATNAASVAAQADIANKNYEQTEKWNQLNYENQLELQKYQRDLQQTIFDREDNSVQRRVEDLKKAGLSPTLAAGTGAGAGSVVSQTAAQRGFTPKDASAMKQIANFELMNNLKLQKQKSYELDLSNAMLKKDLDLYNKTGLNPNDHSNLANLIRFASGVMDFDFSKYGPLVGDYLEGRLDEYLSLIDGSFKDSLPYTNPNQMLVEIENGAVAHQAVVKDAMIPDAGTPISELSHTVLNPILAPTPQVRERVNNELARDLTTRILAEAKKERTLKNQKRYKAVGRSGGSNYYETYAK